MKALFALSFMGFCLCCYSVAMANEHRHHYHHGDKKQGYHNHASEELRGLMADLRRGGHVLLIRHERTNMFLLDKPNRDLSDCNTQRNLSPAGIGMAKENGDNLKYLEIPIGKVISSPMCRTLETARYMFRRYEVDSVFLGNPMEKEKHGQDILDFAKGLIEPNINHVMVGHLSNIQMAFGIMVHEGDTVVIGEEGGELRVVDVIQANGWNDLVHDEVNRKKLKAQRAKAQ